MSPPTFKFLPLAFYHLFLQATTRESKFQVRRHSYLPHLATHQVSLVQIPEPTLLLRPSSLQPANQSTHHSSPLVTKLNARRTQLLHSLPSSSTPSFTLPYSWQSPPAWNAESGSLPTKLLDPFSGTIWAAAIILALFDTSSHGCIRGFHTSYLPSILAALISSFALWRQTSSISKLPVILFLDSDREGVLFRAHGIRELRYTDRM